MNRLTPSPPPGTPARFPSGWRARLGRDPVPILLREGSEALVARVRRDLIDDEEAPGPAEVVTYPEVKAFLKKQEKNGAFPAKPPEKTLGPVKFARAVGTLRALEKLSEFGLSKAHPAVARAAELLLSSQASDGGIGDLALGETPESRTRAVAIHFQGWALSTKMAASGRNQLGSSSVPTLIPTRSGRAETRRKSMQPHSGQNARDTSLPLSALFT